MISQIPPHERGRFEQFIRRFRDRWQADFSGPLVENHFESGLPVENDPLRRVVLLEMVAIDLVTRIERGQPLTLHTYLKLIGELGPADQLPVALLHVEYLHRQRSSDPISAEAYASMFPAQASEFLKLIRAAKQQSTKARDGTLIADPILDASQVRAITSVPKQGSRDASQRTARPKGIDSQLAQQDPWSTVQDSGERIVSLESGYRMIRKIGQGNFGEVWLSEAPGGVEVALKMVRIPAGQQTKHLEMRSLDLMKRVRHPFLMQVQAFWVTEGQILIAMELADQSLRERARESAGEGMPLAELLRYMTEAAEGIDFLHREHVVHRDIKPENLLLLRGHIKVADFGLARFMDESGLTVVATQVAGSPLYMAPEVWEGKPVSASDQYSLAVTYAELRMGRAPFSTSSMVALMQEHLYGQAQLAGLPEPEQAALRIALSKHPNDRFSSCTELVQALVAATTPLVAPEPQTAPSPQRSLAWILIPVLAALVILAIFLADGIRPGKPQGNQTALAIKLQPLVAVAYGAQVTLPISTTDAAETIEKVHAANPPTGVSLEFNPTASVLMVSADLNALVGENEVELQFSTTRGEFKKTLSVRVEHSNRLRLPGGTQPAQHNSKRIELNGPIFYESVEYPLPSGDLIEFLLIPRRNPADPPTFYMMKQEVSNRWFAEFASTHPDKLSLTSEWRKGALAGSAHLGVEGAFQNYPVVFVSVEEAHAFAEWVGGLLPTTAQWDKAAGANEQPLPEGPFKVGGTGIGFNRLNEGPMPCAAAPDDVSVLGIHDLAGNVTELTRNFLNSPLVVPVPAAQLLGTERIILRGNSYYDLEPWKFGPHNDSNPPSLSYVESKPEIGFRVVLELL